MKLTKGKAMRENAKETRKRGPDKRQPARNWLARIAVLAILLCLAAGRAAEAQVTTTTVQGTVYLANGQTGAGTLVLSWPAFTTSTGYAVVAGKTTVTIGSDGFVSASLAPNLGATPSGLYYTAVYHLSDGTTSTEYWVVPAAAQATLATVRATVMPAAQAVQAVTKSYVDQAISSLSGTWVSTTGGTMTGPLYLSGDPTQPLQAADKHYVDSNTGKAVPLAGGDMTGALTSPSINGVKSPTTASALTTIQLAVNAAGTTGAVSIPPTYTGTDTFTNTNGIYVKDWRLSGAQPAARSVKEFGAVCDGTTNDTSALQTALNYANTTGVALTIPQGVCKTHTLTWRGESIGGLGKQVSALKGYPGEDVLASPTDSTNILSNTKLHDLTIYVDRSVDISCASAKGRASAGSCGVSRPIENNSIFSSGGSGLTATAGTGAGWYVGNCAIAMPASTGAGGNGLKVAAIENVAIAATGTDALAASYTGAYSTHTCGLYLAQWPRWSTFRNVDIQGVNTGIAMPALSSTPSGISAEANRWENITIQAAHGFVAAAGSNNALDNVLAKVGNSAATGEAPTGLVLDLSGTQSGWTVRNAVMTPTWTAVQPTLTVTTSSGAVTAVAVGSEAGLGFDPYGTSVPIAFSGSCTASATASVNSDGSIGTVTVSAGGSGCSSTTTASVNVDGTWDTAAPVNLIGGKNMAFLGGNLQNGTGGYTVWNATSSQTTGTQIAGGGGNLPGGGTYAALAGTGLPGKAYEADQFPGSDFGAKLQACVNAVSSTNGGTCDARNFTGTLAMSTNVTIAKSNTTVLLPCATISTANQLIIAAGARNVSLRGCALRGGSQADGSQGGSAIAYTGSASAVQVGDSTYAADTLGFHMDNVVINTTGSSSSAAVGLTAYRTQEMDVQSVYMLGNSDQTGMTLDGTGNYTGGTYYDVALNGFQTAVNAIGHQTTNSATTDWMNASTFVRLHINCPTSSGSPISGTYGINLQAGDGNTFTGGDVEGCSTALHLGASAKNNTIVGLRNENSTNQVVADAGSAYNNWMTGGTMFTGALTDNGTRNSFLDTFHRSFNGMNGDWYGSQQDATVTNHYRLGTGAGNERGFLNRYQTDYGYRWTTGLSDATAGEQFYQVLDELNNVYRLSIGQYNNGQSSTNNQTVLNAAGTGAIVLNGSNNAGTGGTIFGSGGTSSTTVATIDKSGNAIFNGTLQVGGTTKFLATPTVRNSADAEIDMTLWAGLTAAQKESLIYKDYDGTSQWYMVKDAANNWALNSAVGGLDSIKAYQSTNSGDTYINASNSSGAVRVNYESGAGKTFNVYGGSSSSLYASFTGTAAIKFPGLAAASGHNCLQIDSTGYITNTGSGCGTNTTEGTTVSSGTTGQIAYYTGNGTSIGGESNIPIAQGGTGATDAVTALSNLSGVSTSLTTKQTMSGSLQAPDFIPTTTPYADIRAYGATIDGATAIDSALSSAVAAACTSSGTVLLPCGGSGCYLSDGTILAAVNSGKACANSTVVQLKLKGKLILGSTFETPDQMDLVGDGEGAAQSYQMSGAVATIQAPSVYGTMGTAVSTTNASATFTPTFTSGSISNMPAGSAITIAGTTSCAVSSIARASGVVTATLSSACTIPAGTTVTVAGVTDTSFNITPMVTASDYPAKTITWQQSGTDGTSSGGTITGFNESTFETVRVQSVSGSTVTAIFTHAHTAADQWGMVAIAPPVGTAQHHGFENIRVTGNYGAGFWGEHASYLSFKNTAFGETAAMTSIPMEMASSSNFKISRSTLLPTLSHGCTTGCGQQGYPYGFRCTGLGSTINSSNDGCAAGTSAIDDNSVIGAGIKLDTNGIAQAMGGLTVRDTTIEQPIVNAVTEDLSAASSKQLAVSFDHVTLQDSFMGYGFSWINSLYPSTSSTNTNGFSVSNFTGALTTNVAGKYYSGRILMNGMDYAAGGVTLPTGRMAPVGTIADGSITSTELDGIGGSLGPSLIPMATQSVNTTASTWSCSNCTLKTGVMAPDGTTSAAELQTTSGNGYTSVGGYTGTTAAGDCFIFGAWGRAGTNQKQVTSDYGPMTLVSAGGDVFDQGSSTAQAGAFQQSINGNWWHPIVALSCLTTGSTTSHTVDFRLYAATGSGTTVGNQFWNPFLVYVPASSSVAKSEVERWRQQLMHGAVPAGMPAGGGVLAINSAHKLYWGSDTNLYRSAAGVLKTDGTLDAGTGYKCQGSYGASGQVLSTTGSGCQWTSSVSTFTGDGVVLSNSSAGGAVTATLKTVTPNAILAGPSTGSTAATPTYRALTSADLPTTITSNTSGTAAALSAASALPNGTTATTQASGNNSTKVATTAYTDNAVSTVATTLATVQTTASGALQANGCTTTSGGNLKCTSVTATAVNLSALADQYTGSDCGAKVAAADAAATTGVEIQIGQNCGTWTTPVTLSTGRSVHWVQAGTYPFACASSGTPVACLTLGLSGAAVGMPTASNSSPVVLKEADSANMPAIISMGSGSTLRDLLIDGNKSNNSSALDGVLVSNANRVHIYNVTIQNATRDNLHVTNTMYAAPTSQQTLALNKVVTINTEQGDTMLFNTTKAGTGTDIYPICANTVGATCTWGTAVLTNIGDTYDGTSGSGYLGPDVLLTGSGRDGMFTERNADWIIDAQVEFESAARDGFHCEDCTTYRFSNDDFGANQRYGLYAAVVNAHCSTGIPSSGHIIKGSQFGNNAASGAGGDIYMNGSAISSPGFCAAAGSDRYAGGSIIVGNSFIGLGTSTGTVDSVTLVDAGGNTIDGNAWGLLPWANQVRYAVNSSFSALSSSARQGSVIGNNTLMNPSSGNVYTASLPFSLASGIDLAESMTSQGTVTAWSNRIISGSLQVTGSTTVGNAGSCYASTSSQVGLGFYNTNTSSATSANVICVDSTGSVYLYGIGNGGSNPGNFLLTPSRTDASGYGSTPRTVQIYPSNVNLSTNMSLNMADASGSSHAVLPANTEGAKGSTSGGQYVQMVDSTPAQWSLPMWNSDLSLGKSSVKTDSAGDVVIQNGASYSMTDRNGNKLGWTVQSSDGNMVLYDTDASGNKYAVLSIYSGVNSSANTLYANTPMVLANGSTTTTQAAGDASSRIATDSFVATAISNASGLHLSSQFGSTPTQCDSGLYATGITSLGAANCSQVGAAQLSAGVLPAGTTATTQAAGDTSSLLATDSFAATAATTAASSRAATGSCTSGQFETGDTTSGPSCSQIGAAQLSAGALPAGTTATTQAAGDTSSLLATDSFAATAATTAASSRAAVGSCASGQYATGTTTSGLSCSQIGAAQLSAGALPAGTTATTQAASDSSTLVATTAQVQAAIAAQKGYGFVKFYYPSTVSGGNQTNYQPPFPVAATALGATVQLQTVPVGCTTYATVYIYNATQNKDVAKATLAASTNRYTMTIDNASIAAGDVLLYQVGTSASGCTTNAAGIQLDMSYSYPL